MLFQHALGESPYIIAAKRSASTDISLCSCLALARQRHKEDNPEKTFKWDFELSPIRLIAVVNFAFEHNESPEKVGCEF